MLAEWGATSAPRPLIPKHTSLPLNPQPEPAPFINSRFHKWLIISACLSRKLLGLAGAGKHVRITSPPPIPLLSLVPIAIHFLPGYTRHQLSPTPLER